MSSRNSAAVPALALLGLLMPTLLYDAVIVYVIGRDIGNAGQAMGWSLSIIQDWWTLTCCGIVIVAHCLIFAGSITILCVGCNRLGYVACWLSLFPVLTPGLVAGIPFGIWGLIAMKRKMPHCKADKMP
jgi:hypothetical protein